MHRAVRVLRRLRPEWPIALFMLLSGVLNLLSGLRAKDLLAWLSIIGPLRTSEINSQFSLGAFGSGAQAVLGGALILVGIGLLWRYRLAWTFAILLLVLTIAVNLTKGKLGGTLLLPGVVLVALIAARRHFGRTTIAGGTLLSAISFVTVIAYGTFGSFLFGAQFDPPIRTLTTALYYTIVTISTVGFGDIHPATNLTQAFTISLIILGLGVFAAAAASVLGPALSNRIRRLLVPAGTSMTVTDHVIIVGEGSMARNTARELAHRHIPLVQVVRANGVPPLPDQPVVRGEASDDATLEQAQIKSARMVIAATEDDGENAFIALAAKDLNPEVRVIAVASSARAIRRLTLARADVVFAPAAVGGRLLADLVQGQQIPEEFLDLLQSGRA